MNFRELKNNKNGNGTGKAGRTAAANGANRMHESLQTNPTQGVGPVLTAESIPATSARLSVFRSWAFADPLKNRNQDRRAFDITSHHNLY